MFIDSHAHLMFEDFSSEVEEVILRAREAGVGKIINVGCGVEYAKKALAMNEEVGEKFIDFLYATVGLHPYDAADLGEELMIEWEGLILKDKRIVGVGETGLDYFKAKVPKDVQKKSFVRHLELARKVGVPVIIHNRDADEDCLEILDKFQEDGVWVDVVFHCYGSNLEFAEKLWSRGYYASFTGIITYPNAKELAEVVKVAPGSKILIETDCPYLSPQNNRGKRNEPSYVVEVAKKMAEIRGVGLDELEKQLEENTLRLFPRLLNL